MTAQSRQSAKPSTEEALNILIKGTRPRTSALYSSEQQRIEDSRRLGRRIGITSASSGGDAGMTDATRLAARLVHEAAAKSGVILEWSTHGPKIIAGVDPEQLPLAEKAAQQMVEQTTKWLRLLERERQECLTWQQRTPRKMWTSERGIRVDPEGTVHAADCVSVHTESARGHGSAPRRTKKGIEWDSFELDSDTLWWRRARLVDLLRSLPEEWRVPLSKQILAAGTPRDSRGRLMKGDLLLVTNERRRVTGSAEIGAIILFVEAPKDPRDGGIRLNLRLSAWQGGRHRLERLRASLICTRRADPASWSGARWTSHCVRNGIQSGGEEVLSGGHEELRLQHQTHRALDNVSMMVGMCLSAGLSSHLSARVLPKDRDYWNRFWNELRRRGLERSAPQEDGAGLDPLLVTLEIIALSSASPEAHTRSAAEAQTFASRYWLEVHESLAGTDGGAQVHLHSGAPSFPPVASTQWRWAQEAALQKIDLEELQKSPQRPLEDEEDRPF